MLCTCTTSYMDQTFINLQQKGDGRVDRYLTSTELKQNLKRAKEYARCGIVHVLENGREGYVFCSAQVYEDAMKTARTVAAWEAEVREVCYEGFRAETGGNIQARCGLHVAETATRDLTLEYDGRNSHELAHVFSRISEDPEYGMTIELQGLPRHIRKVLVPPHDLIYCWSEKANSVLVLGIVPSLDC